MKWRACVAASPMANPVSPAAAASRATVMSDFLIVEPWPISLCARGARRTTYASRIQLFRKFERESVTEGRFDGVARASRVEREKGLFSGDEFPSGCVPGGGAKMRRSNDCGFGGGR